MNLTKEHWRKDDIKDFQAYLCSLGNPAKKEWTTNILRTEMPVLALTTPMIKNLARQIAQGNYEKFLDFMIWEYYENTAINGFLLTKIKDFATMKKYLDIYSSRADNWATCDLLSFNIKGDEKKFWTLAEEYSQSPQPFRRRIGVSILFNFINDDDYNDQIFALLDKFTDETHYYVNMINAWLLCECFIKQRAKTMAYLEHHRLNKFTINKAVQKCRDSYRVSAEDKEMLLKYKVK